MRRRRSSSSFSFLHLRPRLTCIRLPNPGSKPDKSCNLTRLDFSSENCRKQFYAREFPTSGPVFPGVLGNKSRNLAPRRAARTRGFDGLAFGRRHSPRERRPREVEVVTVATSGRRPVTGRCQFHLAFRTVFGRAGPAFEAGRPSRSGRCPSESPPPSNVARDSDGWSPGRGQARPYGTESQDREEAPLCRWLASAGQGLVCCQIDGGVTPQASSASLVAVSTEAAMWSRALSSESSGGIGKGSA